MCSTFVTLASLFGPFWMSSRWLARHSRSMTSVTGIFSDSLSLFLSLSLCACSFPVERGHRILELLSWERHLGSCIPNLCQCKKCTFMASLMGDDQRFVYPPAKENPPPPVPLSSWSESPSRYLVRRPFFSL